jgi:hypothetical protein
LQLTQKIEHCLLALFWRAGEINLRPAAHVLPQEWIQQGIQIRWRQGAGSIGMVIWLRQSAFSDLTTRYREFGR